MRQITDNLIILINKKHLDCFDFEVCLAAPKSIFVEKAQQQLGTRK